jgi:hypothetical protein
MCRKYLLVIVGATILSRAAAQEDPLQDGNTALKEATHNKFSVTFEERTRWEEKFGVTFGKDVNQQDMLSRIRIGAQADPLSWLTISAMGQDSRSFWYGLPQPNSVRDTMDLHEAYLELFRLRKTGFGASAGRQMITYGEGRLIGVPQWSNVSRTYDNGRMFYRTTKLRIEALIVSPVKVLSDGFNKPELGERIWGTYNTFKWSKGASLDFYVLRHSQNRIGGWTGTGTLGTNTFGGRIYGLLPRQLEYSVEGAVQNGHLGPNTQRAYAWYSGVTQHLIALGRSLTVSAEYKVASGTRSGSTESGTFDQLSPANHDKFGHMDLFGWRNIQSLRSLETLSLTKSLSVNLMYNNSWLYSASDALFSGAGRPIVSSPNGNAGKHVGQELDGFLTYRYGAHLFGAGVGHFFKGEFVNLTTPHINPRYFYIFQQYSFK